MKPCLLLPPCPLEQLCFEGVGPISESAALYREQENIHVRVVAEKERITSSSLSDPSFLFPLKHQRSPMGN